MAICPGPKLKSIRWSRDLESYDPACIAEQGCHSDIILVRNGPAGSSGDLFRHHFCALMLQRNRSHHFSVGAHRTQCQTGVRRQQNRICEFIWCARTHYVAVWVLRSKFGEMLTKPGDRCHGHNIENHSIHSIGIGLLTKYAVFVADPEDGREQTIG